jgi:hypothetical protein
MMLFVSLDQTLAVAGSALGAIGLVVTVVARLRAAPTPGILLRVQRAAGVIRARIPARTTPARTDPLEPGVPDNPDNTDGPDNPASPVGTGSADPGSADPGSVGPSSADPAIHPTTDPTATTGPIPVVATQTADPPTAETYEGRVDYYPDEDGSRRRRRSRRDGRSNAELDDELVTSTVLGWFVLWIAATLALGYVETEVDVLQILAQVAIAGSLIAIGLVVYDLTQHRARHVGWMIDLFVVTAAIAAVPLWFHRPWFGQGRFDHLDDWLPADGSVDVRLNETLKDYGPGIVAHVLVQTAGMAALIAIALYIVATIVRRARGRYGHHPLDRWVSLSALAATLVGAVCASGSAVTVPSRTFISSTFTTAKTGGTVDDSAPALALRADRFGRVSLLFARCGDDRILALTVDQKVLIAPGDDDRTSLGQPVGGGVTTTRVPAGTGAVTIAFRSTRRYETTVVFPRRPRANRFLPLRTKDTLTTFYKRGHAC